MNSGPIEERTIALMAGMLAHETFRQILRKLVCGTLWERRLDE